MQALTRWAEEIWIYVHQPRPDWGVWWEEFVKHDPITANIIAEFWVKHQSELNNWNMSSGAGLRYGYRVVKLFGAYYTKRVSELQEDPEYARLFQILLLLGRMIRGQVPSSDELGEPSEMPEGFTDD
jgi:hypothetical protein